MTSRALGSMFQAVALAAILAGYQTLAVATPPPKTNETVSPEASKKDAKPKGQGAAKARTGDTAPSPRATGVKPDASKPADSEPAALPPIERPVVALLGPSGVLRVGTASGLRPGVVGLGVWGQFLTMDDLIIEGDEDTRTIGGFGLAFSPTEYLETSMQLRWRSNSSNMTSPNLVQSQGNLTLGLKAYDEIVPGVSGGGRILVDLLTGEGDVYWKGDATTVRVAALGSVDLRRLTVDVPMLIHANLGYSLENSKNVADRRLKPVEDFAHGVTAYDTMDLGIALELRPGAWDPAMEMLHPFLEWGLRIPVATRTDTDDVCVPQEKCPGNEGFQAYPHWLTVGFHLQPVRPLTLTAAVDLGLTQVVASGIEAIPPYNLVFGLSYGLDPSPKVVVKTVEKIEEVPCKEPVTGVLEGRVVDKKTRKPVAMARVSFPDHPELSPIVTREDGRFVSYKFAPGKLKVRVDGSPGHKPKAFQVDIEPGGVEYTFSVVSATKPIPLTGRVHDQDDMPVAGAQVSVKGRPGVVTTDPATGRFELSLPPGRYSLVVDANGYLARERDIEVKPGTKPNLDFLLRPRQEMVVEFKGDLIELKRPIHFAMGKAQIRPDSFEILDQIIDIMTRHDIEKLRIEGHTDSDGDDAFNLELSQERADAVKAYLVEQGISPDRLEAKGYGETRPVAPNTTAEGKAKNRRVEFHVVK